MTGGMQRAVIHKRARQVGGFVGWLVARLRRPQTRPARLAVIERITLAPRQSLALIEAEGRKLLVATSPDGAPSFYPLDVGQATPRTRPPGRSASTARISW
jgi:hypothetical protein